MDPDGDTADRTDPEDAAAKLREPDEKTGIEKTEIYRSCTAQEIDLSYGFKCQYKILVISDMREWHNKFLISH